MKYNKILSSMLNGYSKTIRNKCVNYKQWKQRITYWKHNKIVPLNWKNMLTSECKRLERYLHPSTCLKCFCGAADDIHTLSVINSMTMYKVCKKLEKKVGVPSMSFFKSLSAVYQFITFLPLVQYTNITCPVCNWKEHREFITTRCGHYMCKNCTYLKTGITGTYDFDIDIAEIHGIKVCPTCSDTNPCCNVFRKKVSIITP